MAGFTLEVTVSAGDLDFTLLAYNIGTYNATVYWGDTTNSTITAYNDADLTHTYSGAGTYEIEIQGSFPGLRYDQGGDCLKITDIIYQGDYVDFDGWQYLTHAFNGCTNCASLGTGKLLTDGLTDLTRTFRAMSSCNHVFSADFFEDCGSVTSAFAICYTSDFYGCNDGTFAGLTSCLDFTFAFYNNINFQYSEWSFSSEVDLGTRFLNQTVNWSQAFRRFSYFGVQGTAPPLWNYDYGTGGPTSISITFDGVGNSSDSLDNYKNIPDSWGGSAVSDPAITSIDSDDTVTTEQAGVVIAGTDFLPYQYDASVWLTDNDTWGSETVKVAQTITDWSDTNLEITIQQGALSTGTVYAYVETDRSDVNTTGHAVTLESGSLIPTITDVDQDEVIYPGQASVVITGTNFLDYQYTGKVELTNSSSYSYSTIKIEQDIITWSDTSILIDVIQGYLSLGTVYVFVTNNDGETNTTGFEITIQEITEQQDSITSLTSNSTVNNISDSAIQIDTINTVNTTYTISNVSDIVNFVDLLNSLTSSSMTNNILDLVSQVDYLVQLDSEATIQSILDISSFIETLESIASEFSVNNITDLTNFVDTVTNVSTNFSIDNISDTTSFIDILGTINTESSVENITDTFIQLDLLETLTSSSTINTVSELFIQVDLLNTANSESSIINIDEIIGTFDDLAQISTSSSVNNISEIFTQIDYLSFTSSTATLNSINAIATLIDDLSTINTESTVNSISDLLLLIDILTTVSSSAVINTIEEILTQIDFITQVTTNAIIHSIDDDVDAIDILATVATQSTIQSIIDTFNQLDVTSTVESLYQIETFDDILSQVDLLTSVSSVFSVTSIEAYPELIDVLTALQTTFTINNIIDNISQVDNLSSVATQTILQSISDNVGEFIDDLEAVHSSSQVYSLIDEKFSAYITRIQALETMFSYIRHKKHIPTEDEIEAVRREIFYNLKQIQTKVSKLQSKISLEETMIKN
jgi:hypothetical protein